MSLSAIRVTLVSIVILMSSGLLAARFDERAFKSSIEKSLLPVRSLRTAQEVYSRFDAEIENEKEITIGKRRSLHQFLVTTLNGMLRAFMRDEERVLVCRTQK